MRSIESKPTHSPGRVARNPLGLRALRVLCRRFTQPLGSRRTGLRRICPTVRSLGMAMPCALPQGASSTVSFSRPRFGCKVRRLRISVTSEAGHFGLRSLLGRVEPGARPRGPSALRRRFHSYHLQPAGQREASRCLKHVTPFTRFLRPARIFFHFFFAQPYSLLPESFIRRKLWTSSSWHSSACSIS